MSNNELINEKYKQKYLKYKNKYLQLKQKLEGKNINTNKLINQMKNLTVQTNNQDKYAENFSKILQPKYLKYKNKYLNLKNYLT